MWIQERKTKSGNIVFDYYERYKDPITGKNKKVSVTLATNTRQAIKQATQLLQEKIATKQLDNSTTDITFEKISKEYGQHKALSSKPSTIRGHAGIIQRLNAELPRDILVKNIPLPIIQKIINDMQAKRLTRAYIAKHLHMYKAIIRYAKKMGYIKDISYLDDIELHRQVLTEEQMQKKRLKYLEADELKRVLAEIKSINERIGLAMEFMSLTGCRFGELVALRNQDFDGTKININGTIQSFKRNDDPDQRGTPKTAASYRDVLLDARAIKIIKFFQADNARMAKWWKGYEDRGYIFTSTRGNPLNQQEVNRILRKIKTTCALSTHVMRHTHVSLLLANGIPLKAVMERVGISSMKTILEIYTHVTKTQQTEIVEKIKEMNA